MSHVTFDNSMCCIQAVTYFQSLSASPPSLEVRRITTPLTAELRFNPAGFGWKSYKDEANQPTTFVGSDVRGASWFR